MNYSSGLHSTRREGERRKESGRDAAGWSFGVLVPRCIDSRGEGAIVFDLHDGPM